MDLGNIALNKLKGIGKERTGLYQMNLVGFRDTDRMNTFNDHLVYWYYIAPQKPLITVIDKFTTDPGLKSLRAPENAKGCAILCSGFYSNLWKIGYHKGQYKALVQNTPCKVYRDNNRNDVIDFVSQSLDTGVFGINLHHASATGESVQVDGWSAGCQVFANILQWNKFIKDVELCNSESGQTTFDYMLINMKTDM